MRRTLIILSLAFGLIPIGQSHADIFTTNAKSDFALTAETFNDISGTTTAALTSNSGDLQLDIAQGVGNPVTAAHAYREFSTVLTGSEYALSGDENFDLTFSSTQSAFAMDYADDSDTSNFSLNFFNGATNVGSTTFTSGTPFATEKFIGFVSTLPFNRVEIRENDGAANTNEYFQFYSATSAVPEPSTAGALALLAGTCVLRRRRRTVKSA